MSLGMCGWECLDGRVIETILVMNVTVKKGNVLSEIILFGNVVVKNNCPIVYSQECLG